MTAELVYRARPHWTDPVTAHRERAPFRRRSDNGWQRVPMPLGESERLLRREAEELGTRTVVIELNATERTFRKDGGIRADARIDHPGVVVTLTESLHGPLRYATDTFDRWQDNIRAVALALEALRKVDRYGVTKRGEQYRGWTALPSSHPLGGDLTREEAEVVLFAAAEGVTPGEPLRDVARRAKGKAHPDRHGGDRTAWDRVEAALRALDLLA